MLHSVKKALILLLGFFIVLSQSVFAAPHKAILSYADLLNALSIGNEVRAIINLNNCTSSSTGGNTNAGMSGLNFTQFNQYEILVGQEKRSGVATSITMLVESSRFGHVYNYVRLRVFPDNSAVLTSQFLDPKTFALLSNTTFTCPLTVAGNQGGVNLYNLDG